MPLRCGGTTPIAVEASGRVDESHAGAPDDEAGQQRGPLRGRGQPAHQQEPRADEGETDAQSSRTGTRAERFPEIAATMNISSVVGRKRKPV